ncbi:hypothetical protein D9758_007630 [Tetrapyrgos nigripes]|uniref:Zn(2)-C6 fungal-type domain-containing protein n=1 Tax=Tetrapyrgos nigripes TaxID=182062 RepID=A0A8H5G865_9AGAR|nr:hypothetical protein D9758_007630 [Tetrapyrgos nigripes]
MDDSPVAASGSQSSFSVKDKPNPKKNQATSCAECRRLKLKCDRVFPCSSCIRRGCANLCPNGTLEKGRRGFLKRLEQSLPSATQRTTGDTQPGEATSEVAMFVARDAAMLKRIQELEAALITAGVPVPGLPHSSKSAKRHTTNKRARSAENDDAQHEDLSIKREVSGSSSESADVTVGFGTLTIDPQNRSRYIGLSGGSAYLDNELWDLAKSERNSLDEPDSLQHGKQGFDALYEAMWSKLDVDDRFRGQLSRLPPYEEAVRLSKLYFENASFMYEIVPREIYFSNRLPTIYGKAQIPVDPHVCPNVLALVCMVLALGQYFDLDLTASAVREQSKQYFEVAVFALNLRNHIEGGMIVESLPAAQSVHLMVLYQLCVRGEEGAEAAFQLLGMVSRSIQSQGFHIDGSRWGLPVRQLEERRRVFWETYTYDRLQSFTLGRPYAQSDLHYDCEMPTVCDTPLPSDNDPSNSAFSHAWLHHHKYRWAIVVGHVIDVAFSVKRPTYADIMEIDREINDFYFSLPSWILCQSVAKPPDNALWEEMFPPGLMNDPDHFAKLHGRGNPEDLRKNAQIHSFANMVFPVILHLHRGPFCRALMMEPQDMIRSRFEASVARVISSSTAIINVGRGMFILNPRLMSRLWYWLFHSFTAAVCQAVFVIVAPFHPLAPHAFKSLQAALQLFETADGIRARAATARMKPLMKKAASSMETYQKLSKKATTSSASTRTETASDSQSRSDCDTPSFTVDSSVVARFPESNIRRNADEYLGATTKLVRLPDTSSSADPSPSPTSSMQVSLLEVEQPDLSSQYDKSARRAHQPGKTLEDPFSSPSLYEAKPSLNPASSSFDRLASDVYSPISPTSDIGSVYPDDTWSMMSTSMENVHDLNMASTSSLGGHNNPSQIYRPGIPGAVQGYPRGSTFLSRKDMQTFLDWRTTLGFDAHSAATGIPQRFSSTTLPPPSPISHMHNETFPNSSSTHNPMNASANPDFTGRHPTAQSLSNNLSTLGPSSTFPHSMHHPSSHFNDDGFNLNSFIQAGANAWMYEPPIER